MDKIKGDLMDEVMKVSKVKVDYDWMVEAREIAKECWHDEAPKGTEMNPVLVEAVAKCVADWIKMAAQSQMNTDYYRRLVERCAKRIADWMKVAAQNREDADYYRSLIERCGKAIGDRAYITNDGSHSKYALCEKVTEIIEADYSKQAGGEL